MPTNKLLLISLIIGVLLASCSRQSDEENNMTLDTLEQNQIILSANQVKHAELKTGRLSKRLLSETVECNGSVEADPGNHAIVSPPIKGYVKSIAIHIGDYVVKGQTLAILTHPDYINLQKEYLETLSQYEYYKNDFKRQGELSIDQATSIKKMQQAQNDFRILEARLYAYKHQLKFIGLNPDSISVESITSEVILRAPISGNITEVNMKMGMLCNEEIPVLEIMNNKNLILHLQVFEDKAPQIVPGLKVSFSPLSNPNKEYPATLKGSTRSIDKDNTINLHARIDNTDAALLPGMFVNAKIYLDSDSSYTLPNNAVVDANGKYYVFSQNAEGSFFAHEIVAGRINDNWTEIIEFPDELSQLDIITQGAYYLKSELFDDE